MGGVAVKQLSTSRGPASSAITNHLGAGKVVVGATVSPSKGGGLRAGFVDVKVAPGGTGKMSSPPSASPLAKGKGKAKLDKSAADE